jgi:hypothetical protein
VDLAPGRQTIIVPLAVVEAAPAGRPMDMSALREVTLYGYRLDAPRQILFDDFRLTPR